jgi:IS605 OrfB family transposase
MVDRCGNPVGGKSFPLNLRGNSRAQVTATLAQVADVVALAKSTRKPIVVEHLAFRAKKARLREERPRYVRVPSALAYALLRSSAAREGVEVRGVNPAYTSVRGWAKHGLGRGLSRRQTALVAIAEACGFRSRSAFPITCTESRAARRERLEAPTPRAAGWLAPRSASFRGRPRQGEAPIHGTRGRARPAMRWSAAASARDSPTPTVGNAVRPASQEAPIGRRWRGCLSGKERFLVRCP